MEFVIGAVIGVAVGIFIPKEKVKVGLQNLLRKANNKVKEI